ncbi:GNAT family N-acetyltransferase [Anaerorhabdus sp.]|uniref:GNAT family N-acetyltransferase n=1 Tax=Anaerorhabdus sp. TaxID=1872524 RepID=UPI002FC90688
MIRLCSDLDRSKVLEYLNKDRALNLFFIGDINNYGFENDFQKIFIDEDGETIQTVYLVYYENLLISSYTKNIDQDFVKQLMEDYKIENINGEQSLIDTLDLSQCDNDDCYFCKMIKNPVSLDESVEVAKVEDVPEIIEIIKTVFHQDSPRMASSIEDKTGRTYFIKVDGKIVSVASSTAETDGLAMIVGVATLDEFRGQGYASKVVEKLCSDLLMEDKIPCLFYNNPAAGKIYHRIGFEDIGRWALRRNRK